MTSSTDDRRIPWINLSLLVLALDQWSKWMIEHELALFERHSVISGFFNLSHVKNTGIAFGMLQSQGNRLATAALAITGLLALALVAYYFSRSAPHQRVLRLALVLVLGGALGNLLDRVLLGQVTDFFDFFVGSFHWWTFNVADSAISVGLVLLVLDSFRGTAAEPATEPRTDPLSGSTTS